MSQTFIHQIKKSFKEGRAINGKAILAMLIFGMIILTFVLSDINGRRGNNLGLGAAAEVNGEIITLKELQEQENKISAYYAQLFGGKIDNDLQKKQIVNQAMNELVNNSLAAQGAEKERIFATDAELKKIIIEDLPYFKRDGVFQSELYKGLLAANRLTPAEFEKGLKQQAKTQKIRQLFDLALSSGRLEKGLQQELKSKQLNVAYLKLNVEAFKNSAQGSLAAVQKKLTTDAEFAKKVQVYYDTHKTEFESPEQVKASHILVKADSKDDASLAAAKTKAEQIIKRLEKEDFNKVAAQVSDDPGSKAKNGDLGYFTKGRMVKEFEEAAFSLPVGKVSEPIKTPFGFHIIKVTDKKAASVTSFDVAKAKIAQTVWAEEENSSLSKELEGLVSKGDIAAINDFITKSDLKWTESGYYDLSNEQFPKVNSAALFKMSLELSKDKPVAKALVREGDAQYLLKLVDAKKAEVLSTDAATDDVTERQKAFDAYSKWVAHLKKTAVISTNNQLLK